MDDDGVSVRLVNYLSATTASSASASTAAAAAAAADRKNSLGIEMATRLPSDAIIPDGKSIESATPPNNQMTTTQVKGSPVKAAAAGVSLLPSLFERSAHSWWNPRFDSDVLEEQHFKSSLPQNRRHILYVLGYVLGYVVLSFLLWGVGYGLMEWTYWVVHLCLMAIVLAVLGLSFTSHYRSHIHAASLLVANVLAFFEIFVCIFNPYLTSVGTFTGSVEFLVIVYKFIPLPLYACVSIGAAFSVIIETLSALYTEQRQTTDSKQIVCRALLHLCIHIIGIHVYIMAQVRRRSTFMKVGQSILARRDLQVEKQLKHNMIHSLMPPKVAEEIMKSRENDREEDDQRQRSSQGPDRGKMNFRSFHMSQMDKVSILFADIVGFTRMSSNKSAEHLVSLLNDLFGRFDDICKKCNCEKISTLGDCYYCVSGCPEPRVDHAKCCVEMGLAMCIAIKQFDDDHCEEVNMRVGVHTGTVLCGLVGTRRFKFDVWSHDVTLANMMESEGRPGCVHVSDCTYNFISQDYEFESGDDVPDIRRHKVLIEAYSSETQQYIVRHVEKKNTLKTWFIVGRRNGQPISWTAANDVTVVAQQLLPLPKQNDVAVAMELNEATTNNRQPNNGAQSQLKDISSAPVVVHGSTENPSTATQDEAKGDEPSSGGTAGVGHLLQAPKPPADEQTDSELVKCISECTDVENYLYHPPINQFTLHFLDRRLEEDYRSHCWGDSTKTAAAAAAHLTLALPHITSLIDVVVSFVFFLFVSICCLVAFCRRLSIASIAIFVVGLLLEVVVLVLMLLHVFLTMSVSTAAERAGQFMSSWYPRHLLGALIACLPTLVVFSLFSCDLFNVLLPPSPPSPHNEFLYCLLLIASLLHFCNFTMLCSLMKSTLAAATCLILILLLTVGVCPTGRLGIPPTDCTSGNSTNVTSSYVVCHHSNVTNSSAAVTAPPAEDVAMVFSGSHPSQLELIFDVVLLLLLLCFLNREIEIGYRVCYHGDVQAVKDRQKIETEKEQADWLLHNIVPEHVADLLKHHDRYCKNHKDVGVIFAKISNFDDFYDESFEGGKEYLRVLNELMGDFEDLFDEPKYKDVEKIKTIGSCLMAASGLNPQTRNQNKDPNAHLYALMDFSIGILHKLEEFNKDIFNFDFEMAVGFNFGEVTAGVIGTTKLLYDIWGDTVNIASRMYSTGVHERIQVTEDTAKKLGDKFDFEYRGQTYVKGKGDMNTYLLVGKKAGATWD